MPDKIPSHVVHSLATIPVVVPLHEVPGLDEGGLGLVPYPVHGSYKRVDSDISGSPSQGDSILRMIPMIDEEGGMTERCLDFIVV